jgi:3-hydroxyisobutyrate dehydrogenase-like beta-hydroxyacid dehydrogenase
MAKIGFLGLGMMGFAMASRLLDAGNDRLEPDR